MTTDNDGGVAGCGQQERCGVAWAAGAVQCGVGSGSSAAQHGQQEQCGALWAAGVVRCGMGSRSSAAWHGQ